MHSPQLPGILQKWHRPPRHHKSGIKTRAAKEALDLWALSNVTARINREMRLYAPQLEAPAKSVTEDELLSINLKDDMSEMKEQQPVFWELMSSLAYTPRQRKVNTLKNNDAVSTSHAHIMLISLTDAFPAYIHDWHHVTLRPFPPSLSLSEDAQHLLQGERLRGEG